MRSEDIRQPRSELGMWGSWALRNCDWKDSFDVPWQRDVAGSRGATCLVDDVLRIRPRITGRGMNIIYERCTLSLTAHGNMSPVLESNGSGIGRLVSRFRPAEVEGHDQRGRRALKEAKRLSLPGPGGTGVRFAQHTPSPRTFPGDAWLFKLG